MKAGSQYRYFSKQDLSEMFTLDNTTTSATQHLLTELHDHNAHTYPYLDSHIQFLHESLGIVGVNHHDLLFSENPEDLEPSEEGRAVAVRAQNSVCFLLFIFVFLPSPLPPFPLAKYHCSCSWSPQEPAAESLLLACPSPRRLVGIL